MHVNGKMKSFVWMNTRVPMYHEHFLNPLEPYYAYLLHKHPLSSGQECPPNMDIALLSVIILPKMIPIFLYAIDSRIVGQSKTNRQALFTNVVK